MNKKLKKISQVGVASSIAIGQYVASFDPNQPWSIGLVAFIVLLAGANNISSILFDDIDIEQLKNQVEENPDDARLFWTIIDAGMKESAKKKIGVYNSYLKKALNDSNSAKDYNSKILLVIQQITLPELDIFERIYKNFDLLRIINLISSVDKKLRSSIQSFNEEYLLEWFEKFINENSKDKSKDEYLNGKKFYNRPFTMRDLLGFESFLEFSIKNEVDMLVTYGLLHAMETVGGTTYRLTEFGKYMFNFLEKNKNE